MCVCLHSENSQLPLLISQTTPDEHPSTPPRCRWPALFTYPPSPSFSSFGAASVMLYSSAPPTCSSPPLRPSVHYPSTSLVNLSIQTFCNHLNALFFLPDLIIVLKSGWSSTARMPASSLVLLPSLPLSPRRHSQADGQLSPLPPSPSFSSFGAAV